MASSCSSYSSSAVAEACSNVETRDLYTKAKKKGTVNPKSATIVMYGFTGVGKTHVQAIILSEVPPSKRISTALAQLPVRAIGTIKMTAEKNGVLLKRISEDNLSCMFMKAARDNVIRLTPRPTNMQKLQKKFHQLVYKPPELTDELEKDQIVKFHQAASNMKSFDDHILIEMSDCGGQPQFLEILPWFLHNITLIILVIDLSQHLDDHPMTFYYNLDGVSVGKGVKYPLTNEQVLRLCMRMVASQTRGSGHIRIVIVGTHRDLEGNCTQSREEKNRLLKEMVESFGLKDCVVYKDLYHEEFIFSINAKDPEEVDHQTAGDLRKVIYESANSAEVISIPFSYYGVEQTLKKKVEESGHIAFLESDLLKEVSHYYFTEESLKAALRYLHQKKLIFFFEEEFPGRVIGKPQTIFDKHTEVVAYHIEISTNPVQQRALAGIWKKFRDFGILNVDCLKKFPKHYVEGVFTPVDMMKLFEKLLIVSEVSDGEYLMPCVLPAKEQAECIPVPETQSVPPMVLHFPGGPARYGVFCGTICHVMTESKWKLFKSATSEGDQFSISRNSVHFSIPGYLGKVTLNDPLDSFFVVTVHLPPDVPAYSEKLCHLCAKVRDTVVHAIDEVTYKLNYIPDSPEIAFLCEEHMDISLHPATVSKLGDKLLCTKIEHVKEGPMTAQHRVWLGGI